MLQALKNWSQKRAAKTLEKSYGEGAWMPYGSSIPKDWPSNFWQMGLDGGSTSDAERFPPILACINVISQETARIPIQHLRDNEDGSATVVRDHAPARVLHKPNHYQTSSDWMLNLMYALLTNGNAYCFAVRNNRNEVSALYPINPRAVSVYISPGMDDNPMGEIFYRVSKDPTTDLIGSDLDEDNNVWIPQRNMLHIRLYTTRHPLIGESPLMAAALSSDTGMKILKQQNRFFGNASRPSGVLTHPKSLSIEATQRLKQSFINATHGSSFGEPVVLQEAMTWTPLSMTAVDAEIINSYKLTERAALQLYRLPSFLLGDSEKSTFASVESQLRFFSQTCIGFYADHIEKSLAAFFNLGQNERIHFDIDQAMLRGDMKERMEGLKTAVQGGVLTVNEARRFEHLSPVEFGDSPRMQQQMVPLSYGENVQPKNMLELPPPEDDEDDESVIEASYRLLSVVRAE